MATLSITAANVTSATTTPKLAVQAGETVTAGLPVYRKASDGLWYKMQADGSNTESGVALDATSQVGIALGGATVGVWFVVQTSGTITIGASGMSNGTYFYIHATAGLVGLLSDLSAGQYITMIGYANSATTIALSINATALTV